MPSPLRRLRATALIAATLLQDHRAAYRSPEAVRELRDRRLRSMVRHAIATVPYYRDLFRGMGMAPGDIRTFEDLERLPLIDKRTVRAQPERFLSQSAWGRDAIAVTSSGSTGQPFTVFHDRNSLLARVAFDRRQRGALSAALGRRGGYSILVIGHPRSASGLLAHARRPSYFSPWRTKRAEAFVTQPLCEVLAALNHLRPDVLEGYGSYLDALFKLVAARELPVHRPKVVVYGADHLSPAGIELIEDHFGIPVLSIYGTIEALEIGFTCEVRQGFHLQEDLSPLRVVDGQGRTLPKGEIGELVVSNLVNRATVLLNYRTGDRGALSDGGCPCGRTLPLLAQFEGRVQDVVAMQDGGFVYSGQVSMIFHRRMLQGHKEVLQHQLIQHDWDRFELRLATPTREDFDRVVPEVLPELADLLGQPTSVEAVYFPERLPTGEGGKLRMIISHVKLAGTVSGPPK